MSNGTGLEARKMRKTILLSSQQLLKWDKEKIAHIANMHRAKFTQCPQAQKVLLATKNAELWHYLARLPKERTYNVGILWKN